MLRIFYFTIFFFFSTILLSQSFENDYQPIKSSGTIPDDFTFSTKKKIKEELTQIDVKNSNVKGQREYTILTNYALDKQLHGGNILMNDELSNYVNRVADELLIEDKELRNKLKIFVTKVPETNAYCMGKGYIFVDIGLLSQISSEAQLAFILAHEISHFTQNHNLKSYFEIKAINKEKYRKQTFEDRILRYYRFSKENETEADTLGLKLYRKSKYALSEVNTVFDVLQYSYLPFDEIKFDSTFFNDEYYKIPAKYFLSNTQKIKANENYDDTKSTHPNIKKRKQSIDSTLTRISSNIGKKYLVSEKDFYKVRDIARFECCRLFMVERNYFQSMMSAYILLKKYPNNIFLHKIISKSLFAMTLYKTGDLKYDNDSYRKGPIPDFTKTEGYSQQLNFFLDKLPPAELAVLTLKYNLMCHQKYANETSFLSISDSLLNMLPTKFALVVSDFSSDSIASAYYKNAFYTMLKQNNDFKLKFEKLSLDFKQKETAVSFKVYDPKASKTKKVKKKEENVIQVQKLNINKILVVDPFYKKMDTREPETYAYSITDNREATFIKSIQSMATKNQLICQIIDPGSFSSSDIDNFNNFSVLQDWFNERLDGGEDQCDYVFSTEEASIIRGKYTTQYCMWVGVIAYSRNYTFFYALLMDIETGKVIYKKFESIDKVDSPTRIEGLVNETLKEIKLK